MIDNRDMKIYLVVDYGIEGLDVKEHDWAIDALEEVGDRKTRFLSPVTKIIQGSELTYDQLLELTFNQQKEQSNG